MQKIALWHPCHDSQECFPLDAVAAWQLIRTTTLARSLEPPGQIQVFARFRTGTTACYSWTIFESPRPQYRSFSSRL